MTPIINLSHISYNYEEVSALNDISLEIYAGELIFFTGSNGCGKSTLFKLLNGLIFPTKGEYYFDNKKIDKNTLQDNIFAKNFHKRIGYIFQNPDVLMIDEPLNGLDNKTRQWFKDFLIDFIKANKTILISTHEQELLSLPHSRIIKFNDEHTILN